MARRLQYCSLTNRLQKEKNFKKRNSRRADSVNKAIRHTAVHEAYVARLPASELLRGLILVKDFKTGMRLENGGRPGGRRRRRAAAVGEKSAKQNRFG
jgi:hypothetical protein